MQIVGHCPHCGASGEVPGTDATILVLCPHDRIVFARGGFRCLDCNGYMPFVSQPIYDSHRVKVPPEVVSRGQDANTT